MTESIEGNTVPSRNPTARRPAVAETSPAPNFASGDLDLLLKRLDVVTHILGGWIWETDVDHRYVYVSPSVTTIAGKPPEWHYGKTRQDLGNLSLTPADGESWVAQLERREPFGPVDFIRYQSDGALIMRSLGKPQFAPDGAFAGYCGISFAVPSEPSDEPSERRGEHRRKVVRAGEILLPGNASPIACVLLDISTSGARLRLPDQMSLPETFELKVVSLGFKREAAVRWRRGDEVGVEFAD